MFNFSSNNPIDITKIVKWVQKDYKIKIKLRPLQRADIVKTHGSNKK